MLIKILKRKNYLKMIENAAKGENWMFRNFYVEENDHEKDVLENGGLSCAVFASSILYLFNSTLKFSGRSEWLDFTHANVLSTEKDMQKNNWQETNDLKPGAVLIWEKKDGHDHIGFYMGNDEAISNDSRGTGFPWKHHYTYNGTRKIEKIYWHPELND